MKLISTLLIPLLLPLSILSKQICLAPSGCPIEMDTGNCPNCIEVKENITKKVSIVSVPVRRVKTKTSLETPTEYYQKGYPTQPRTNLLTSSMHHWKKKKKVVNSMTIVDGGMVIKKIKTSVPRKNSPEREFALCRSGCLSSRAATMNYPINGIWYRHKPSKIKLQQMTKEDCKKDVKLIELLIRVIGVDTCETDMRKRYISSSR